MKRKVISHSCDTVTSVTEKTILTLCSSFDQLTTMPPAATAHAFCASLNGPMNSGFLKTVPANTKGFLRGL